MKKNIKGLVIVLVLVMLMSNFVQAAPATLENPPEINVKRISGSTRIQTAIEASKVAYQGGSETVLLAGYRGEVDALTGTLLANAKRAPLLLTVKNKLSDGVEDELNRLKAKNVIILGGTVVVSKDVETALASKFNVTRVSGSNRADTAVKIAKEVVRGNAPHIFLALGYNDQLADALAIGPVSAIKNFPVLLTQKDKLPSETAQAIKDLDVKEVTIVGGYGAISKKVESELKGLKINRVSGNKREETALAIANKYFNKPTTVMVAYGWNYADALVGGYIGAKLESPILLTNTNKLSLSTKRYIRDNANNSYVLGGDKVISSSVLKTIRFANEVSIEDANYIGNRNTSVFHRMKCRALPNPENRVYFELRKDATDQDFSPCGICKP